MEAFIGIIGVLLLSVTPVVSRETSPEKVLIDALLTDYSPIARPIRNHNDTVGVDVGFTFIALMALEESHQRMTYHGMLTMEWLDPFLTWNPANFSNIEAIFIPHDRIWRPDLVVLNSAVSVSEPIQTEGSLVKLQYDGSLLWAQTGMFQSSCNVDITFFPFDNQTCYLIVGTNAYDSEFVTVRMRKEKSNWYTDIDEKIRDSSQWEVIGEETLFYQTNKGEKNLAIFILHVKRRSHYFVMNIVFPSFVMALLNIFVLIIPHELSDKVGVGTTLVLAYIVFLLQITDTTPTNSDQIPFVSVILLVVMTISAIDVAVLVVFLRCLQNASSVPPPTWLLCVTRCGKFASNQRKTLGECSQNSAGEAWVSEANGQDKSTQNRLEDSEVWQRQWTAVIYRLERGVLVIQIVIVVTMFSSIPCLYFSQMP